MHSQYNRSCKTTPSFHSIVYVLDNCVSEQQSRGHGSLPVAWLLRCNPEIGLDRALENYCGVEFAVSKTATPPGDEGLNVPNTWGSVKLLGRII